jgi:hypothetical protein
LTEYTNTVSVRDDKFLANARTLEVFRKEKVRLVLRKFLLDGINVLLHQVPELTRGTIEATRRSLFVDVANEAHILCHEIIEGIQRYVVFVRYLLLNILDYVVDAVFKRTLGIRKVNRTFHSNIQTNPKSFI